MPDELLVIDHLSLAIDGHAILHDLSLTIAPGEAHGLVGESGSGKSITALSVVGLLPRGASHSGAIRFDGRAILGASEKRLRSIRGDRIGMVFQEPMTALNPLQPIDRQVAETVLLHRNVSKVAAREMARAHLGRVGIGPKLCERYPHQLSGGQRQRVVVAIATVLGPDLVIADEPTTALDVVRQREVLDLLRELEVERGSALLLITHDVAVVADVVDRITVLRDGRVVDRTTPERLEAADRPSYTAALVAGAELPGIVPAPAPSREPILKLERIERIYGGGPFGRARTVALADISLDVPRGGSIGLVGGSGSGKSTLARIALMLDRPTAGTVTLLGTELTALRPHEVTKHRRDMQIVFQDPNGSFDPRRSAGWSVAEPLHTMPDIGRAERTERVAEALRMVDLSPDDGDRYPHQFSGGQRQRLAIARAIITRPALIVADEPVSALDVSVRGRVLELFARLREELGLALLFIGHDLNVIRAVAHDVAVMHDGEIVERGPTASVLDAPRHPATKELVAAAPDLHRILVRRQAMANAPTPTAMARQASRNRPSARSMS